MSIANALNTQIHERLRPLTDDHDVLSFVTVLDSVDEPSWRGVLRTTVDRVPGTSVPFIVNTWVAKGTVEHPMVEQILSDNSFLPSRKDVRTRGVPPLTHLQMITLDQHYEVTGNVTITPAEKRRGFDHVTQTHLRSLFFSVKEGALSRRRFGFAPSLIERLIAVFSGNANLKGV